MDQPLTILSQTEGQRFILEKIYQMSIAVQTVSLRVNQPPAPNTLSSS
jgi:hypothetical protein